MSGLRVYKLNMAILAVLGPVLVLLCFVPCDKLNASSVEYIPWCEQGQTAPIPDLRISPAEGTPGSQIIISGTGLNSSLTVDAFWDLCTRGGILGFFPTDNNGFFEFTVSVPEDAVPGKHTICVFNTSLDLNNCRSFTVIEESVRENAYESNGSTVGSAGRTSLPSTGSFLFLQAAALAMIFIGVMVIGYINNRRRRFTNI